MAVGDLVVHNCKSSENLTQVRLLILIDDVVTIYYVVAINIILGPHEITPLALYFTLKCLRFLVDVTHSKEGSSFLL